MRAPSPIRNVTINLNLSKINPVNLLAGDKAKGEYAHLPSYESSDGSREKATPIPEKWRHCLRCARLNPKLVRCAQYLLLAFLVAVCLAVGYRSKKVPVRIPVTEESDGFPWEKFPRVNGFYEGIKKLVPKEQFVPGYPPVAAPADGEHSSLRSPPTSSEGRHILPIPYYPYPSDHVSHGPAPIQQCFLDEEHSIPAPSIHAYPGIPQHAPDPLIGSYTELGLRDDVCFERYGRLGVYGMGYEETEGGTNVGLEGDRIGIEGFWPNNTKLDWRKINIGEAQRRCLELNKARFRPERKEQNDAPWAESSIRPSLDPETTSGDVHGKKYVPRTAFILRTYTGVEYDPMTRVFIRALINELSLHTGGEYQVHLLVQVKDETIPIWASEDLYDQVLRANVPEEFHAITTLWSEKQMGLIYSTRIASNFENMSGGGIIGVYRSHHLANQYFASQHPEYDFFWNWEMDIRYTGHYFEFVDQIGKWAAQQPRKGAWERSARFYIPSEHGNWSDFMADTESRIPSNESLVWGPPTFNGSHQVLADPGDPTPPTRVEDDDYSWGVGEEADFISLNPLFNPENSGWVFRNDVSGYDTSLPIPPRRTVIITASRLSRRLLSRMHDEVWAGGHTMFSEMWPGSVALHHGLKAVYAPHPVYFDRAWPTDYLDATFNDGPYGDSKHVFGTTEHNHQGSSFYYNSGFAGALWRRWLGFRENGEGGKIEESEHGRMCIRGTLVHPIKWENGPLE